MTMIEALNTVPDSGDLEDDLMLQEKLLETLSVMQHHDAMTGTHMQAVGKDYLSMMASVKKSALKSEGSTLAT